MENACLQTLPRTVEPTRLRCEIAAGTGAGICRLKRDETLSLEKKTRAKMLQVNRGILWLTGTPANGDVILEAGQAFEFQNHWPYVIQALEASEICIA